MEVVNIQKFRDEYLNNLKQKSCLPQCLSDLCGGWSQETFKQCMLKVTKKNSAPLPLWFENAKDMNWLTTRIEVLQQTFNLLNTRKLNRVDASELYAIILFMAEGDYTTVIQNIPLVFGFRMTTPPSITRDEFFFFLDALFRGIGKILILQGFKAPLHITWRLHADNIKSITDTIYLQKNDVAISNEELPIAVQRHPEMNEFFYYLHEQLQKSLSYSYNEHLQKIKRNSEVRAVINQLIKKVELNFQSYQNSIASKK